MEITCASTIKTEFSYGIGTRIYMVLYRLTIGPAKLQVPFLLQPPYLLPHMNSSPEIFLIALESMDSSASNPPALQLTPAHMNLMGDRENDALEQIVLFGQRWAAPPSKYSRRLAWMDTLLLSGHRHLRRSQTYGPFLPSIWSPSTHTLRNLPPLLVELRNYDEHTKLPSGSILFDISGVGARLARPILSEGRQYPKVTWMPLHVYTKGEKSDNINLVIPHTSMEMEVSVPRVMDFCPISGTLMMEIDDENDDRVLKIAITRVIELA
ncbi:hypothetical protein DL93DRAFT_385588 [Clavulina sp. PMI_390]|nr:hypothetical protein DL93DRAFT_385588 [Clavulina sp. PMI_390]